jgi:hypothetical protein
MKRANIFFWIYTGLLIPALGIGPVFEIMKDPDSVKIIAGLGYSPYLAPFLGVVRILPGFDCNLFFRIVTIKRMGVCRVCV